MGIASDLSDIKDVSDTIVANKVSRFCYTQQAYNDNDADGVSEYNADNEQNIPNGSASVMKVNETVISKGWRARASSITRMLMNHFLGRLSYNVNKLTDMLDSLLTALSSSLDTANGIASVDSNGKVALLNNVVNTGDSDTPAENGTDKFTTGGAYTLQQAVNGKAPTNHASSGTTYGVASGSQYGHVKTGSRLELLNMTTNETLSAPLFGGWSRPSFFKANYTSSDLTLTIQGNHGGLPTHQSSTLTCYIMILKNGVVPTFNALTATVSAGTPTSSITITVPAKSIVMVLSDSPELTIQGISV